MKLLRPHIPLSARCHVALIQLGEMWPETALTAMHESGMRYSAILDTLLTRLASLLRCEVADLQLDHDPALGARRKVFNDDGEHVEYEPPANDPKRLLYRIKAAHKVKSIVRGEHGQLSDISLTKRNRRQEEREGTRPKSYRTRMQEARAALAQAGKKKSRPIKSSNRWPPKGSRKFGGGR